MLEVNYEKIKEMPQIEHKVWLREEDKNNSVYCHNPVQDIIQVEL